MGRKTKLGKTRKDKFYKLAKETGYRSRAAFKLIQLNRKFGFLQESQVCIDLCAAPGGWMQVAKQNMPISSIVIGVDLFPIKPVGGCIGLIGDITTDACRTALAKELGTWKADVVLHDGAPNVGKNWLHDAFQQITLTLSSLKLATQFLRHGGWFVTKVFRSKDYNALLWVLKQLFRKVHATKPSASRKESAEIFVVCEKYIAPDKIDPRLLDPRYVFEELELETKTRSVLHPEKQRKVKAEGYTEKDFSLRHELPVSQFIEHPNGIVALQGVGEIVFDDEEIACHAKTTTEIRECCKDIKVLGRKDVKVLIAWWRALHREWEERQKPPEEVQQTSAGVEKTQEELEDEELDEIEAHVAEVALEEAKDAKRRKKKASKLRTRLNEKMNLKMVLKGDEGPREEADDEVFTLKNISSARHLEELEDQTPDLLADSDNEPDSEFRPKFVKFARDSAYVDDDGNILEGEVSDFELSDDEAQEEASDLDEEGLGLSAGDDDSGNEADVARAKEVQAKLRATNPLLQDLDYRDRDTKRRQRVQFWYEKDNLKALDDDVDEEHDLDRIAAEFQKKGVQILGKADSEGDRVLGKKARKRAKYAKEEDADTTDTEVDEPAATSGTQNSYKVVEKIGGKAGFDVVKPQKKKVRLSEEELALGSLMAGSKRKRRDLVDAAWNRYAFGDEDLPEWFVRDEQMHMRKEAPVPKELVGEYRKRMEEINVRPIKKVMEAKARKKKRALKRLTKAKKKAEAVLENPDASSQEKIRQIRKLYKKAEDKKKDVTYVVSRKAFAGKKARRPPGVKGRYRIVDLRQKKDKRATTAREKRQGKRRK